MYHIIIMCTFVRDSRITIGILSFTNGRSRNLPRSVSDPDAPSSAPLSTERGRVRACLNGALMDHNWTPSSFFS